MPAFMKNYGDETYALFRFITGMLFLCHGTTKLFGWPGVPHEGTPEFVRFVAGGIEAVGGLAIAVGFMTRFWAFLASGLMAAAYWMAHGLEAVLPINNRGELAVLYCFAFLYISARGAGTWGVDSDG